MTMKAVDAARVDLDAAVCLFRGLADPARLSILRLLMTGERRVRDLTEALGLAQSTVSQHLACLVDCGLVTPRSAGRSSWYSLTRPELLDLLLASEVLLAAAGSPVSLCENYGLGTEE